MVRCPIKKSDFFEKGQVTQIKHAPRQFERQFISGVMVSFFNRYPRSIGSVASCRVGSRHDGAVRPAPARRIFRCGVASLLLSIGVIGALPTGANAAVVSACSGVSLPPSVVTGILTPVLGALNPILNIPPFNLGTTLTAINGGAPISLQVLDTNGNVVSNTAPCVNTATAFQLNTPAGIAFGGNQITGLGNGVTASAGDINAIAIGNGAVTSNAAIKAVAIGFGSSAAGVGSIAFGPGATTSAGATNAVAIGNSSNAGAAGSIALGANATTSTANDVALGTNSVAGAADGGWAGTTIGGTTIASNVLTANAVVGISGGGINRQIQGVADGAVNATSTDAINGSQLFYSIQALSAAISVPVAADNVNNLAAPNVVAGRNGVAIGYGAASSGQNSVALGNGSTDGGRANVVSVGAADATRQIINVGAGTQGTDAVNVSQLQPLVTALGGGTTINTTTGAVTGPTYNVGGTNYTDVGSALAATNKLAVQYTPDANGNPTNQITLSGANNGQPVRISNVAAGVNNNDAVNVGQLNAVSSRIDQFASGLSSLAGTVAQNQNEALRGIAGATAMANLPFGSTPGKWSPAVSFGGYKGQTAIAMGVQYNTDDEFHIKIRATASLVPGTNDVTFGGGAGWEF
jgi:trimeric autotransporter adhesin